MNYQTGSTVVEEVVLNQDAGEPGTVVPPQPMPEGDEEEAPENAPA